MCSTEARIAALARRAATPPAPWCPSAVSGPRAGPPRGQRGHGAPDLRPRSRSAPACSRPQTPARFRRGRGDSRSWYPTSTSGETPAASSRSSRAIRRAIITRRARSAGGSSRTAALTSRSCWRAASSSRRWRPMLRVSAFAAAISRGRRHGQVEDRCKPWRWSGAPGRSGPPGSPSSPRSPCRFGEAVHATARWAT